MKGTWLEEFEGLEGYFGGGQDLHLEFYGGDWGVGKGFRGVGDCWGHEDWLGLLSFDFFAFNDSLLMSLNWNFRRF